MMGIECVLGVEWITSVGLAEGLDLSGEEKRNQE